MRKAEAAFLCTLAGFLAGFCALGLFYYAYPLALLRFPLLAAAGTLVVVALQLLLLRGSASADAALMPKGAGVPRPGDGQPAVVKEALWLMSILPLVFLLGFPAGLAVYLLCYLKHAGETWVLAGSMGLASLALSYGLFMKVIGVALPFLPVWWPF